MILILKEGFKIEIGDKLHILPLVYATNSVVYIRDWLGRWLCILLEGDGIIEWLIFNRGWWGGSG